MIDPPSTQPPSPRSPSSSLTLCSPTESEILRSCPPSANRLSVVQYNLSPDQRSIIVSITQESPALPASRKESPKVCLKACLAACMLWLTRRACIAEVLASPPPGPSFSSGHTKPARTFSPSNIHPRSSPTRYVAQPSSGRIVTLINLQIPSFSPPYRRHRLIHTRSIFPPQKRTTRATITSLSRSTSAW